MKIIIACVIFCMLFFGVYSFSKIKSTEISESQLNEAQIRSENINVQKKVEIENEFVTRAKIQYQVKELFLNDDFDKLNAMAEKFRSSQERTSSGLWKLTVFYYSFNDFKNIDVEDTTYWNMLNSKTDKWLEHSTDSPTAHIVKGHLLKSYAWSYRGSGYAEAVPEEAWLPFKKNLSIAKKYMDSIKNIGSTDPQWYDLYANIHKGLTNNTTEFKHIVDEGLDRYPNYYQLYFSTVDYLSPRWHGNIEEIEEFANDAVQRTEKEEGLGLYARIYWAVSGTQQDKSRFVKSDVVWKKMRLGIFDVVAKYPDSWNIQNFAHFSCLAEDRDTTKKLLDMMHENDKVLKQAWNSPKSYNECYNFAYNISEK